MLFFLALVAIGSAALFPQLKDAFAANAVLNGMILGVLLLGIVYIFQQVLALRREIDFMQHLKRESSGGLIYPEALAHVSPPRLLGPMATMLREKRGRLTLSPLSMRTLIDSINTRIDEGHQISRYLIGLLIFLGLLGTFWGLVQTVNAVGMTIGGLSVDTTDSAGLFEELKRGLEVPLAGMGTAFSSSLFGLAGSLVLGFLELQAGQAHNRFMNELEEWLSGLTRLSSGGGGIGEGEGSVPAYLQALLERTADSLERLQRTIARGEEDRQAANRSLTMLTERLSVLTDQMRGEQDVIRRLAETQSSIKPLLAQLTELRPADSGLDEATRDHIRHMNIHLANIAQDLAYGREQTIEQIRAEIRLLARTIAALAEEAEG